MRLSAALLTIFVAYFWWPATLDELNKPPCSAKVVLALAAVLYVVAEIGEIFLAAQDGKVLERKLHTNRAD